MLRRLAAFVLAFAAVLIAVVSISFAGLNRWARGKTLKELAENPAAHRLVQAIGFKSLVANRHPACTWREAWTLAGLSRNVTFDAIGGSLRIVRTDGSLSLVRTPYGELWMPTRDIGAAPELFLDQQDEIYQPPGQGVRPGDTVLDCGANIGVYTKFALSKGAARVVAIDLSPEVIECLRRNFTREIAAGSVTIYPKGVWDTETSLELNAPDEMSSMASTVSADLKRGRPAGVSVPVTTIDKLVDELSLTRVDFIKMDIEGAEAHALLGARSTLERFKPRLAIALEHRPDDPDTLPQLIAAQWPFYRTSLSRCSIRGVAHIQPYVMYAHSK